MTKEHTGNVVNLGEKAEPSNKRTIFVECVEKNKKQTNKGSIHVIGNIAEGGEVISEEGDITVGGNVGSETRVVGGRITVGGNVGLYAVMEGEGNVEVGGDVNWYAQLRSGEKLTVKGNISPHVELFGKEGVILEQKPSDSAKIFATNGKVVHDYKIYKDTMDYIV